MNWFSDSRVCNMLLMPSKEKYNMCSRNSDKELNQECYSDLKLRNASQNYVFITSNIYSKPKIKNGENKLTV